MEWINVNDNYPPNGLMVLAIMYDPRPTVEMEFIILTTRFNDEWRDENLEVLKSKWGYVTHWMLLPDVPSKKVFNQKPPVDILLMVKDLNRRLCSLEDHVFAKYGV